MKTVGKIITAIFAGVGVLSTVSTILYLVNKNKYIVDNDFDFPEPSETEEAEK